MPCPDGVPIAIHCQGDISRVHALTRVIERNQGRTLCKSRWRAIQPQTLNRCHRIPQMLRQLPLICLNPVHANAHQILTSPSKSYGLCNRRCACLETSRDVRIGRTLESHLLYHLTTSLPWRHLSQKILRPPEKADAGGRAHLVPRGGDPINSELLDIHGEVRHRLASIEQYPSPHSMGSLCNPAYRIDAPEHVGHVRECHELGARCEERLQMLHIQFTILRDASILEHQASAQCRQLPRHKIGMVFHAGQHHLVAGAQVCYAPAPNDQVDGVSGPTCEHHLQG
mmetsp:Transcript_20419/g.47780  ORF Transcript_20419/g.47780 Transcript_20419/m.47780 type:complete len:284 (-) Transcript_20419:586-1437(-)